MRKELLATLAAAAIALGTMSGTAIAHGNGDRSGSESGVQLSNQDREAIREAIRSITQLYRDRDVFAVTLDTGLSSRDRRFIEKAAEGARFEIAVGQLAAQKAMTSEVKALGTRLAADHTTALAALTALAEPYGVPVPETMSDHQQDKLAELTELAALGNLDFDDAFTHLAKKDHREDIAAFRREARKGRNPDVRSFAEASMPLLKQHLMAAKATSDVVEQQVELQQAQPQQSMSEQ